MIYSYDDAHKQGQQSYAADPRSRLKNPFKQGHWLYRAWHEGFDYAQSKDK